MEQVKNFDEDAVLLEVGSILLSTHECKGILQKRTLGVFPCIEEYFL